MTGASRPAGSHPPPRAIEQLFVGDLTPSKHDRVWNHLRSCDRCRSQYDAMRDIEDSTFSAPSYLNPAAIDRLALQVVPQTAAAPRRPWLLPVLTTLSAAMALFFVAMPKGAIDPATSAGQAGATQEWGSKGSGLTAERFARIHVYAIEPEAAQPVRRLEHSDAGALIAPNQLFQMAYSNDAFGHMVVFGLDESFDMQWYDHQAEPTAQVASSTLQLSHDVKEEPFGQAWNIAQRSGALRIFALFSDAPIDRARVEQAIAARRAAGADVRSLASLPELGLQQDSVLLQIK